MPNGPVVYRRRRPHGTGGSLPKPRHTILSNPGRRARRYDVDASFMQPGVHGCGIHAQ
jgi:hypothetical protein